MFLVCSLLFFWISIAEAAHHGDACFANIDCTDSGLTCTGAQCYCYMDLSEEIARYWACNKDDDCPFFNSVASGGSNEVQDITGKRLESANKLACIPSEECPLVEGFSGYCYVDRG